MSTQPCTVDHESLLSISAVWTAAVTRRFFAAVQGDGLDEIGQEIVRNVIEVDGHGRLAIVVVLRNALVGDGDRLLGAVDDAQVDCVGAARERHVDVDRVARVGKSRGGDAVEEVGGGLRRQRVPSLTVSYRYCAVRPLDPPGMPRT